MSTLSKKCPTRKSELRGTRLPVVMIAPQLRFGLADPVAVLEDVYGATERFHRHEDNPCKQDEIATCFAAHLAAVIGSMSASLGDAVAAKLSPVYSSLLRDLADGADKAFQRDMADETAEDGRDESIRQAFAQGDLSAFRAVVADRIDP